MGVPIQIHQGIAAALLVQLSVQLVGHPVSVLERWMQPPQLLAAALAHL